MSTTLSTKTCRSNLEKHEYSPPLFLSTTFAISYRLSLVSLTASLTHTFFLLNSQLDTHARLICYIFSSMLVFGYVLIEVYRTQFLV